MTMGRAYFLFSRGITGSAMGGDVSAGYSSIDQAYLLVMPTCHCYLAPDGERFINELWAKDLARHTDYISNISVAAPLLKGHPPADFIPLSRYRELASVRFVDLPPAGSNLMEAVANLPRAAFGIWKAIAQTEIVHSGVIGWPLPLGLLGIVFGRLQRKFVVTMVESTPWRLARGGAYSVKYRARACVFEFVNRRLLGWAHVAFFTNEDYLATLLPTRARHRGHVIHASWIDEEIIREPSAARESWGRKTAAGRPLKLLFAGRLVDEKGVGTLLEAARIADARKIEVEIDILGDGPLRAKCDRAAARQGANTRIRVLGTMHYRAEFFDLLSKYHAVVVPSLSDEQPRIVYDAYACGVPVLASDTAGLRSCVVHGQTGFLDEAGSAAMLAERIAGLSHAPRLLMPLGLAARDVAEQFTHRSMHARRAKILYEFLGPPRSKLRLADREQRVPRHRAQIW
jgi:glycosyltransferase involved in cell wall biosynthesis